MEEVEEGSIEDREEKQTDDQYDYQQGFYNPDYPAETKKDSQFMLFREIVKSKDSTKVSNLDKVDLLNVRLFQDLALYCKGEGLEIVSNYLKNRGEVVLATAMSKKGFFLTTMVTQFRKVQRLASEGIQKARSWFNRLGKREEEANAQ